MSTTIIKNKRGIPPRHNNVAFHEGYKKVDTKTNKTHFINEYGDTTIYLGINMFGYPP